MSYVSTFNALNINTLTSGQKLTLAVIASFERAGKAWPSVATIAKRASLSVRSVNYHIAALIKLGYIQRIYRQGRSAITRLFIGETPAKIADTTPAKIAGKSVIPESVNQIPAAPEPATPEPQHQHTTDTATPLVCFDIEQPNIQTPAPAQEVTTSQESGAFIAIDCSAQPEVPEWAVSDSRDEMLLKAAVQAVETALGCIDTPSITTIEAQQSLQIAPESTETSQPIQTPYLEVSEPPTPSTAIEVEADPLADVPAPVAEEPDLLADIPAQLLADLGEVRKAKKKAIKPTKTEVQHWYSEAQAAGWSLQQVITAMVVNGWARWSASWVVPAQAQPSASPQVWTPEPHTPASASTLAQMKEKIAQMRARWKEESLNAPPPMRQ